MRLTVGTAYLPVSPELVELISAPLLDPLEHRQKGVAECRRAVERCLEDPRLHKKQ
jgi:hypothetical protein